MPASDYETDKSELLRYLGYRGQEIDGEMAARIDRMSALCLETAEPRWVWRIFDAAETPEGVSLAGTELMLRGGDIGKHLHGAKKAALMAVTLGMESERELYRLEHTGAADGLIFSAAGTSLTETAADRCQAEITAEAERLGGFTNFRFSPGYGDFPLEQQREILTVLDASRRLGITLTDGGMMQPRKSVTAVIGIFEKPAEGGKRTCDNCSMADRCRVRGAESCGK